jgi:TonB family protein
MTSFSDAFTADEIAHASGVSRDTVDTLIASGELRPRPGTLFFSADDALRAARRAREIARHLAEVRCAVEGEIFELCASTRVAVGPGRAVPNLAAAGLIGLVVAITWLATRVTEAAPASSMSPRLVFLALPGEGGGGGGGGLKNPLPPPRLESAAARAGQSVPRVAPDPVVASRRVEVDRPIRASLPKPEPQPRVEEPLPSRMLIAPVAASGRERTRDGEIDGATRRADSNGPGQGAGAGSGQGLGNGAGSGAGIGPGAGGGTGGGPYRPGSGIEPPRLVKEVKATYTEDARRQGITGNVVLEIVVTREGTVDSVSVLRGLGAGLDQRAIAAVREWRFLPARRRGEPVDVVVEVAVEFALR